MNDRTHVHFSVEKRNERPDAAIAPMILITFVENALKYGVSSHVRSDIFIGLALDGDWLHFTTRNPVVVRPSTEKSGFGIVNWPQAARPALSRPLYTRNPGTSGRIPRNARS